MQEKARKNDPQVIAADRAFEEQVAAMEYRIKTIKFPAVIFGEDTAPIFILKRSWPGVLIEREDGKHTRWTFRQAARLAVFNGAQVVSADEPERLVRVRELSYKYLQARLARLDSLYKHPPK